jgi:phosphomannomutase
MLDVAQFDRGSDFRGDYPRQVNEELAYFVGRYLVRYLRDQGIPLPRIVVGRDGRLSSPAVYAALIQGVAAEGGEPLPAGLAPTDAVCWAAGSQLHGASAGVMITASHNPPEYNGIKMVRPIHTGALPGLDTIRPIYLKKYLESDQNAPQPLAVESPTLPFPRTPSRLLRDFVSHACRWAPDRKEFRGTVVIDPGNGVGSVFLPPLREEVPGAKIEAIAATIDGRFPSRPSNPGLPGAMDALAEAVRDREALFGAAFDGDADRLFMVDEEGTVVTGDQLLAAIIATTLPDLNQAEKPVAFTGTCSWSVVETVQQHGGVPYLSKVGQDTLKRAMQNVGAVFGGESSAHFNFPQSYYQDSGLIALMAFWQALHRRGQSVSQIVSELPRWYHSGEINIRILSEDWVNVSKEVVARLTQSYRDEGQTYVLDIDGVSVYSPRVPEMPTENDLFLLAPGDDSGRLYRRVRDGYKPDWWFSLRRSNNEPLLRLNVETASKKNLEKQTVHLLRDVRRLCEEVGKADTEIVDWGAIPGLKKALKKS